MGWMNSNEDRDIEGRLADLETLEYKIREVAKKLMTPGEVGVFPLDFLAIALMDRSVSIIFGFTSMIRANNFTCAAPLIRLHLDSLLRFYACWIHSDPHELASSVLKGEQIRRIKDRTGKKMTDAYLVEQLSKEYPWVGSVYEHTSGWVHLSKKHMVNSTGFLSKDERIFSHKISRFDTVSEANKIEGIDCMTEITNVICEFLEGWNQTKRITPINANTE